MPSESVIWKAVRINKRNDGAYALPTFLLVSDNGDTVDLLIPEMDEKNGLPDPNALMDRYGDDWETNAFATINQTMGLVRRVRALMDRGQPDVSVPHPNVKGSA